MGSGKSAPKQTVAPQEGPIETPVTDELKQDKGISRANVAQNRAEGNQSPSLLDDEEQNRLGASANLLS